MFWALLGYFWVGVGTKTVLESTHVVEQLIFSMLSPILTFDFDIIWGLFLTFQGSNGLLFWVGVGFKNCFGVYSCS